VTSTGGKGGGGGTTATGGSGVDGGGPATITLDFPSHDFGVLAVGQMGSNATFALTNVGGSSTGSLSVNLSGTSQGFSNSMDGCNGHVLVPGDTCRIVVGLTPTTATALTATLTVSASPGGQVTATLTGAGVASDSLKITPTSHDFGTTPPGMTSVAQTFMVTNTGSVAVGSKTALATMLAGNNPTEFVVSNDTCTSAATLVAGAGCSVAVSFKPASPGDKTSSLLVSASPGGTVAASLSGTAPSPAALTLAPASGSSTTFGTVNVGSSATETFTVANGGGQASTAVTVTLTGSGFTVVTPAAGDCVSGTTTLAPGASCTIHVRFSPSAAGGAAAALGVSAMAGGTPTALQLSGTGAGMASFVPASSTIALGTVEVGTAATGSVTLMNGGNITTGAPTLTNNDPAELTIVTNGCMAALSPNGSCMISFKLTPSAGGSRSAIFSITSNPGGTAAVTVTATGAYRLTITKAGSGTGTVTSMPAGLNCGSTCSALFVGGTQVTVQARTTNGSGSFVSDVRGGGCAGPQRDCVIMTLNSPVTVTTTFSPMNQNLVFVSSMGFPTNLGNAAAYDAKCNAVATAAGINTTAGNGYVAVTCDAASLVTDRLGTSARGWVRMDGGPFADTQATLLNGTNPIVFDPVFFDETGVTQTGVVQTGCGWDDTAITNQNCMNFTIGDGSASGTGGLPTGGGEAWIDVAGLSCSSTVQIYCMGKTKSVAVAPTTTTGRKVWLTNEVYQVGGASTPDQVCQMERPAGVTTAQALIATTSRTAASVLAPGMNYVRVDGSLVGTGAALAAGNPINGIWQSANGNYTLIGFLRAWTGAADLNSVGLTGDTCGNWTNPAGTGVQGVYQETNNWWDWASSTCDASQPANTSVLYCVQTAP
jgi:hypothetical protein